jgi:hypothetical protein
MSLLGRARGAGGGQPQQPAPAVTAVAFAAGSQHEPAAAAASVVPQHGAAPVGTGAVAAWPLDSALGDVQQPIAAVAGGV